MHAQSLLHAHIKSIRKIKITVNVSTSVIIKTQDTKGFNITCLISNEKSIKGFWYYKRVDFFASCFAMVLKVSDQRRSYGLSFIKRYNLANNFN